MGKVKIKRKSTFIDMTAMSDVTVLLLTFFMLTSTFLQKEPITVLTPSSVSEIKVPTMNVITLLVSPEGQVFMSLAGDKDSLYSSEKMRAELLLNGCGAVVAELGVQTLRAGRSRAEGRGEQQGSKSCVHVPIIIK